MLSLLCADFIHVVCWRMRMHASEYCGSLCTCDSKYLYNAVDIRRAMRIEVLCKLISVAGNKSIYKCVRTCTAGCTLFNGRVAPAIINLMYLHFLTEQLHRNLPLKESQLVELLVELATCHLLSSTVCIVT